MNMEPTQTAEHNEATETSSTAANQPDRIQLALFTFSGIALVALATWSVLTYWFQEPLGPIAEQPTTEEAGTSVEVFDELVLEARAAVVLDVAQDEILFSRNGEAQLPLASITKLMTALVTAEQLNKDAVVSIEGNALSQEGDSGLTLREQFRFQDLLDFTLLESSNDGAYALALAAVADIGNEGADSSSFESYMNRRAEELNLLQTHFSNPTGLDTGESITGGYGSARDVAYLLSYIIREHPDIVESTRLSAQTVHSLAGVKHEAENTNDIVGRIPGLIASKTGFTDLAGGNLVVAYDAGISRPIIVAVLGSTEEGRFRDVEKLVQASLHAI